MNRESERKRLVEKLSYAPLDRFTVGDRYSIGTIQKIADHLLDNGIVVPPCEVGDKVYYLRYEYHGKMIPIPCTVDSIVYDGRWLKVYGIEERQNMQMWHADDFGKTVFTSWFNREGVLWWLILLPFLGYSYKETPSEKGGEG